MTTPTTYPTQLVVTFFPEGADTRNAFLKIYDLVYIVNNPVQEESLYNTLSEYNVSILYPNGKTI